MSQNRTPKQNALTVLAFVMTAAVVVLSILQLLDIWESAIDLIIPLLGASQIINALVQWKQSPSMAKVLLASGCLILVISIVVLIL